MMKEKISESIFQKRIKRFKSMKRGYYSLIILGVFYLMSLLGPLWINNKALVIRYQNCLLYTSPSPRDATLSRMPSSA